MGMLVFILGGLIGSFLNVCAYRILQTLPSSFRPSQCHVNIHRLNKKKIMPFICFFRRSDCGSCSGILSLQVPLIAGTNGFLFIAIYKTWGISLISLLYGLLISLLILITIIDLLTYRIPDILTGICLLLGIIFLCFGGQSWSLVFDKGLGLLCGGGLFLVIAFLTGGAMGGGDIKLMGALGFIFGWKSILLVTLISFNLGAIIGGCLLISRKKGGKEPIPFGPFIVSAVLVVMFYQQEILELMKLA